VSRRSNFGRPPVLPNVPKSTILTQSFFGHYGTRQRSKPRLFTNGRVRHRAVACSGARAHSRSGWCTCSMWVRKPPGTNFVNLKWPRWTGYDVCCTSFHVKCLPLYTYFSWKADRTEPYTRITPFQERHDTTVECVTYFMMSWEVNWVRHLWRFFYKPVTLSALTFGLVVLAYVAMTQDVLEEGRDKRRVYVVCLANHSWHLLNPPPQRRICSHRILPNVLYAPVPWRSLHSASPSILAYGSRR